MNTPGSARSGRKKNWLFTASEYPEVASAIRDSCPDLLLVGMPAPFKEIWCEEQRAALQVPAVLGSVALSTWSQGLYPCAQGAAEKQGSSGSGGWEWSRASSGNAI